MRSSFLDLPRELRDQIYTECLVAREAIALSNLRNQRRYWPRRQSLALVPDLFRVSRQMLSESRSILYEQNVFYIDLTAPRKSTQLRDRTECSRCRQRPSAEDDSFAEGTTEWHSAVQLVRRLQVSTRPTTYLHWRLKRQRTASCQCTPSSLDELPRSMSLDFMIIRVCRRSLMLRNESAESSNWNCIALGYETVDSEHWRAQAKRDLARQTRRLLAYAKDCAKMIVLGGPTFNAYACSQLHNDMPQWMVRYLREGRLLPITKREIDSNVHIGFIMRERLRFVAELHGELVVDIAGPELAQTSFKAAQHDGNDIRRGRD